jgi:DNA-binding transcriptional ArsR family regulator
VAVTVFVSMTVAMAVTCAGFFGTHRRCLPAWCRHSMSGTIRRYVRTRQFSGRGALARSHRRPDPDHRGVPTRLRLLIALLDADQDVTALAAAAGMARPTVSQHLAKLRLAGLVATRRDGRHALYRLRGGHVRALLTHALAQADHGLRRLPEHD